MSNTSFEYEKYTFDVVDKMFENNYIVNKIQQEPYNDFITSIVPLIISQYNPIIYKYEDEDDKTYELHLIVKNSRIVYPKVCDNDGTTHELTSSLSPDSNSLKLSFCILGNINALNPGLSVPIFLMKAP